MQSNLGLIFAFILHNGDLSGTGECLLLLCLVCFLYQANILDEQNLKSNLFYSQ